MSICYRINYGTNRYFQKEEFFRRFKPSTDPKVVTDAGHIVTEEPVLAFVKELKGFIEKGDVNGYCALLDDDAKMDSLNPHDCSSLFSVIITSGRWSVFELYSSLLDCDD